MNFNERLKKYMDDVGCSSKRLAEASGLSPAVISRYRRGERTPGAESEQLKALAQGIALLERERTGAVQGAFDEEYEEVNRKAAEEIADELTLSLYAGEGDFKQLSGRFNEIITLFRINVTEMSRSMSFDASYFSKIRTGKRRPANPEEFIASISNYIVKKYNTEDDKRAAALLMECSMEEIDSDQQYAAMLCKWFGTETVKKPSDVGDFLNRLDESTSMSTLNLFILMN